MQSGSPTIMLPTVGVYPLGTGAFVPWAKDVAIGAPGFMLTLPDRSIVRYLQMPSSPDTVGTGPFALTALRMRRMITAWRRSELTADWAHRTIMREEGLPKFLHDFGGAIARINFSSEAEYTIAGVLRAMSGTPDDSFEKFEGPYRLTVAYIKEAIKRVVIMTARLKVSELIEANLGMNRPNFAEIDALRRFEGTLGLKLRIIRRRGLVVDNRFQMLLRRQKPVAGDLNIISGLSDATSIADFVDGKVSNFPHNLPSANIDLLYKHFGLDALYEGDYAYPNMRESVRANVSYETARLLVNLGIILVLAMKEKIPNVAGIDKALDRLGVLERELISMTAPTTERPVFKNLRRPPSPDSPGRYSGIEPTEIEIGPDIRESGALAVFYK